LLLGYIAVVVLGAKLVVYDGTTGTIASGWMNFSWAKVTLTDTTFVATGDKYSASMVCAGWQGFYLSKTAPWNLADYNLFTFWINGGKDGNEDVTVQLTATNNSLSLSVTEYIPDHVIPANKWVKVSIPISHFQVPPADAGQIKGFWFQANSKSGASLVYFDDVTFELGTVPPVDGPNLTVDATSTKVPIHPEIFGVTIFWGANPSNYETFAQEIKLPLNRIGGDSCTRYNWEQDSSNAGVDWFFMGGSGVTPVPGAFYDNFITINNKYQTRTVVTVPMIQYINKDSPVHCSFPKSVYGPQQKYNPYVHPNNDDCGNGVDMAGKNIVDKDPTVTDILNTPEFQQRWIQHITSKYGNAQKSGIIYQLDNEVSNWAYMHRDIHPQPVTYAEIVNQTLIYSLAIKQADATAKVAAPSEIQFAWYPDWGGDKNVIYFLQNLKAYQDQHGQRLLDIYDVHYPDANDNHWPKLTDVSHLRKVVDQYYPGTDISFSEWTMAGAGPLNGALAVADQLGHFAQNGVAFASIWGLGDTDITGPLGFVFRVFRNYDGKGSMFGDQYISGSSTGDDSVLSVHAALRSSDGALTILVINKIASDQKTTVAFKGFTPSAMAHVFEYGAGNEAAIVAKPDISVTSAGFTTTFSSFALTMVVVPRS
jgi:phage pi2 protein 07